VKIFSANMRDIGIKIDSMELVIAGIQIKLFMKGI